MALSTHNSFGKISIRRRAVAKVAAFCAMDCYGVVELLSRCGKHNNPNTKPKHQHKGVKINIYEKKINLHLYVILKYGVSIAAVAESIKSTVKYKVELFTCMLVDKINIHVVGIGV